MIRWESGEAAHTLSSGFVTTGWENALGEAFRRLDLSPLGKFARVGYEAKSCGCLVESASGKGWLKLTGVPLGLRNVRREPEEAAQDLVGVPKPGLIAQQDWSDGDLCWRATVTVLVTAPTLMQIQNDAILDDHWVSSLRTALEALGRVPTEHHCRVPDYVTSAIAERFGVRPHGVEEWRTAHGDLSWDNLTAPELMLFDWETWGLGAARL